MTTNGLKPAPGPRGYPGVGVLPRLARDPITFCTAAMRTHDDLVRLDLGFASAFLVTLPEHIQHVLVDNQDNYGFEDLGKLEYTSRVIQEVLRFYPSFWFSPRASHRDDVIGGHPVPGGSVLILSHYSTHHHPRLWEDPERFDPDRFLPERAEGRPRHAYYPFGTGPRMCIGRHFANLEMLLVLSMAAQQWRPRLAPGHRVEPVARIAIRSKNGVWMNLERG